MNGGRRKKCVRAHNFFSSYLLTSQCFAGTLRCYIPQTTGKTLHDRRQNSSSYPIPILPLRWVILAVIGITRPILRRSGKGMPIYRLPPVHTAQDETQTMYWIFCHTLNPDSKTTKISKRSWTSSAYCNVQAALAAKMWPTLAARPTGIFPGVPAAQSTTGQGRHLCHKLEFCYDLFVLFSWFSTTIGVNFCWPPDSSPPKYSEKI